MPSTRVEKLIQDGDKLFSDRKHLDSLWQEISLNFYPEMAEFTSTRSRGTDFADHLSTSFPLLARRTLGDSFAAFLRPPNLNTPSQGIWFSIAPQDEDLRDIEAQRWLEFATARQRKAMYNRSTQFVRATKEGDHSFATFGQCVISVELNRNRDGLLYRSWHLKDVVWAEGSNGEINHIQRKWKPTASQLANTFGDRVHQKVKDLLSKDPAMRIETRHVVIRTEDYEQRDAAGEKFNTPWVSIWHDKTNDHTMEEVGVNSPIYVIPRWVTVPGSQYAASPAVTAALPDARLVQAMTLTILEAGEKFADPPLVAVQEAVRSDVNVFAGGVTWVDPEYDQREGQALTPLFHQAAGQGVGVGLSLREQVQLDISKAFFLDALSLPPAGVKEMTAFEVGERISEWIRAAMPIFEPVMIEYNGQLCEATFDLLLENGGFGAIEDIPPQLRGRDVAFKFESPLHQSSERTKGAKFLEAQAVLAQAVQLDPNTLPVFNAVEALRDTLSGILPADWVRDEAEVEEINEALQKQQAIAQLTEQAAVAAGAAKDLGSASKDFAAAEGPVA